MSELQRVDKLTIKFLVDNCIEWMTKLPPGFSNEVRLHLQEQKPPLDPLTGVPFLDLENYCCGAHGFSALIETEISGLPPQFTLFDTGPDSKSIKRNIESLQVSPDCATRVVISHWHSDHTGGLLSYLSLRSPSAPPCVIDVHPSYPLARGISPPPYTTIVARIPADPTFEEMERANAKVEKHDEPHVVANQTVFVSGEIPRVTEFEQGLLGGMRFVQDEDGQGKWEKEEHIMDERYAAVDVAGKGLVLFSACSHAGIVNVVKDAVTRFRRPIHMIVGGLHLAGPELEYRIQPTADFLSKQLHPAPTYVLPMHCTGFRAKIALESALGEGCVPAGVGMKVDVDGDREGDKRLFAPVF